MRNKNGEWGLSFEREERLFRLQDCDYYTQHSNNGLKEMDYAYFTDDSLDLIECKEVTSPSNKAMECSLKGSHSVALIKTALLSNEDGFPPISMAIPKDIPFNLYFVFKTSYEEKSQLASLLPKIEKTINPFKNLWNIRSIEILSDDQVKDTLEYIGHL